MRNLQAANLLDSLFPRGRQRILSLLLMQPSFRWTLSGIARELKVTPSSLQRELASLVAAGILLQERSEGRTYYQANVAFPLFPELQSLFIKTTGVADKVRLALEPCEGVDEAFIYGSVATGDRTARSDIDLMLIGSAPMQIPVIVALRNTERELGAAVNTTAYSWPELAETWRQGNHFLKSVWSKPKIFVKGSENELADALVGADGTTAYDQQAGDR